MVLEGSGHLDLWAEVGLGARITQPGTGRLASPVPTAQLQESDTGVGTCQQAISSPDLLCWAWNHMQYVLKISMG